MTTACSASNRAIQMQAPGGPEVLVALERLNGAGSLFVTRPSLAHYIADRESLEERVPLSSPPLETIGSANASAAAMRSKTPVGPMPTSKVEARPASYSC